MEANEFTPRAWEGKWEGEAMEGEGRGGEGRGTVLQQKPNGTPALKALSGGRASRAESLSGRISDDGDSSD